MRTPEAGEAARWLAERGVPLGPELDSEEIAHEWTAALLADDELSPVRRLRTALGLLDLLEQYWVTAEIGFFLAGQSDPAVASVFWAGYRRRLEGAEPPEQVLYSLWVDWFEDRETAAAAFAAVLGDDVRALSARGRLDELAGGPLHRRAARVLEYSGPVPWGDKHDVYEAVATVPALVPALFKGLLASHHDYFGDLEPAAALALLDRLDLPPDTEHLASLRAALTR